ncbi:hypothetical protein BYT27DRAFT_7250405 [Phlegmacium glaucopus]|nr:hypothetical protein BYT27DRAFT_7250405 [Phlegmacium glaucopus]
MTISLAGLPSSIDPSSIFSRTYRNMKVYRAHAATAANHTLIANGPGHNSAPPTTAHPHSHLRKVQLRSKDVARVCNAVAQGGLIQKITVPVQGEYHGQFAKEVTRVSQEIGTEQKRWRTSSRSRRRRHMARIDSGSQQIGSKFNISTSQLTRYTPITLH